MTDRLVDREYPTGVRHFASVTRHDARSELVVTEVEPIVDDPDFIANWIVDLPESDRNRSDADIVRRMIRKS